MIDREAGLVLVDAVEVRLSDRTSESRTCRVSAGGTRAGVEDGNIAKSGQRQAGARRVEIDTLFKDSTGRGAEAVVIDRKHPVRNEEEGSRFMSALMPMICPHDLARCIKATSDPCALGFADNHLTAIPKQSRRPRRIDSAPALGSRCTFTKRACGKASWRGQA